MFRNYLTVAFRNLVRHKVYSAINISGLAVGMACCILILLYVQDELSYDRFHEKADRIYRVVKELDYGNGRISRSASSPRPMALVLPEEFPEIEKAVRLGAGRTVMSYGDKRFSHMLFFVDPGIFEVFDFPLLRGDPKTALSEPSSIVITQAVAGKYFGDADPMGKILTGPRNRDYKVTGILRDVLRNSHLRFDVLVPQARRSRDRWLPDRPSGSTPSIYTYVLLPEGCSPEAVEKKLPGFVERFMGEHLRSKGWNLKLHLQPLTGIHLHSDLEHDRASVSSIATVHGFSAVAIFILLIACINFMNLSTARATRRAKEVGLRKTVGAHRWQLIGQFLGESVLMALVAFLLAVALVEVFLPTFNGIAGRELQIAYDGRGTTLLGLAGIPLLAGLVAGSYPAFFLSSFEAGDVLKGTAGAGSRRSRFRKVLVTVQFAITTALLIGTGIVYAQMDFASKKELGVDKDHVISVYCGVRERFESVKNEWLQGPGILDAAASSSVPFRSRPEFSLPRWPVVPEGALADAAMNIATYWIDYDFLRMFGVELVAGRDFSQARFSADTTRAFIVNESAVKRLGWESPEAAVGKRLVLLDRERGGVRKEGTVIGVVRDFHMQALYREIEPMIFHMSTDRFAYVSVKVSPNRMSDALAFLRRESGGRFDIYILDEYVESQYRADERRGRMLGGFTALAISIACLGLFGLASFAVERRTREIGIRKTFGAPASSIVVLLSKDFVKPVLLTNIVAWPVAYYAMRGWLQNFAYRIDLGIGIFALSGILALVIAIVTVSYQALRAALANPVDALRYE